MAYSINDECVACGTCAEECPVEAIEDRGDKFWINLDKCTECGTCAEVCPTNAIVESE